MAVQTDIAVLVLRQTTSNLRKGISEHKLIECCGEHGCGDIDQDRDPGVALVSEGFDTVEHRRDDARPKVTRHIEADGERTEADDYDTI
jgi:hypothetical protein